MSEPVKMTIREFMEVPDYMERIQISKVKYPFSALTNIINLPFMIHLKTIKTYKDNRYNQKNKFKETVAISDVEEFIRLYNNREKINPGTLSYLSREKNIASFSNCYNFRGDCSKCSYNNYETLKGKCQTYKYILKFKTLVIFDKGIKNQPNAELYDILVGRC